MIVNKIAEAFYKRALMVVLAACIVMGLALSAEGEALSFTQEEKDYLARKKVLKAVSIDGGAPLHYRDSKGEIKGIAVNVLKEVSAMTGITMEYNLYDSVDDALGSDFDIAFGLTKKYTRPGITLSAPYLESETILYYHKSLDPNRLEDKVYAAVKGGRLPEGIAEERVVYFKAREFSLDAVEEGKADYGFGNAYSVAFYTLQKGYKNIYTIPIGKEDRAYCMGIREGNDLLLPIVNKSLGAIDQKRMDRLILDVASKVERKVTFPVIMDIYGKEILFLTVFIMALFAYSAFLSARAKNQFKMENKRYRLLSELSNEHIFEYQIKTDRLNMTKRLHRKIDLLSNEKEIKLALNNALKDLDAGSPDESSFTIKLPSGSGDIGVFRVLFSCLRDGTGRVHSVIGKLVDISAEEKEREQLIAESQVDGLSQLFNRAATIKAIKKSMIAKEDRKADVLLIIDCDNFKEINDTYGHLVGDEALKSISRGLKLTFRQSDILGRIGGDEFCVYMHDIPSVKFVRLKTKQLADSIRDSNKGIPVDVSIGISILRDPVPYERLFKQADEALYRAKRDGGAQAVIYDPEVI